MALEVVTFGCRLNAYESELIKKSANEAGLENAIIFNSCAVTSESERQLKQAIRRARRKDPQVKIIVTGCAAQINPQKYAQMQEVDSVIGNEEKKQASSYLSVSDTERVLVNDIMSVKETATHLVDTFEGRTRAFLQVQNGCNHRCTFCIIPFGRGNSRSVPIGEIVKQVKLLTDQGYNEIVLTGVDITDYGLDLPGSPSLGQMIRRVLNNVPKLLRLRLSSIDVAEVDEDLLWLIANEPRFMPYLHLSLQSGDNMILKRMKRRHSREQILEFCNKARQLRPGITFGADIIAGFPTETEEMFSNSLAIIEEAGLTWLHVFPYSERDGTPASRMPAVPKQLRKERAKALREMGQQMVLRHYQTMLGKRVKAIVEGKGFARAEDFSMIKLEGEYEQGSIIELVITGIKDDHLTADLVSC